MKKTGIIILIISIFSIIALAEPGCDDYYFGLDVEQDYTQAFDCYQAASYKNYLALTAMYLNGEGVGQDFEKARDMWRQYTLTSGGEYYESDAINKFINDTRNKKHPKRVDYSDLSKGTLESNYWVNVQGLLREQQLKKMTDRMALELSPELKRDFVVICRQYEIIKENDSERAYELFADGSIRDQVQTLTQVFILNRHKDRLLHLDGNIMPQIKTAEEYANLDKKLNEAYDKAVVVGDDWVKDMSASDVNKMTSATLKEFKEEYFSALKKSQKAWIKYRDAWISLYKKKKLTIYKNNDEVLDSVGGWLTAERTEELDFVSGYCKEKVELKPFSEEKK